MRNSIFDLENGGRLINEVDLYTSKYGNSKTVRLDLSDYQKLVIRQVKSDS